MRFTTCTSTAKRDPGSGRGSRGNQGAGPLVVTPDNYAAAYRACGHETERRRQIEVEGWTPEHDDQHGDGSMSLAAACYALSTSRLHPRVVNVKWLWGWTGWASSWFKPKDRRRNKVRAAALLLAEIERLDRAAPLPEPPKEGT
mgnify:CR=1 FL=1